MTMGEIALSGFMSGLLACAALAKMSLAWGAHHYVEDIFRNDM